MKKFLPLFVLLFLTGAADPLKTTPSSFSTRPTYDANGILTGASWYAEFAQWAMVDSKKLTAQSSVGWDGVREDFVVVVDGMKLTPKQVTEAVGLIAAYVLANPPPAP